MCMCQIKADFAVGPHPRFDRPIPMCLRSLFGGVRMCVSLAFHSVTAKPGQAARRGRSGLWKKTCMVEGEGMVQDSRAFIVA